MHNDSNGGWIDLHSFSKKYGVSLSTLRRRIRSKSIEFQLMKGRYWLPDLSSVMDEAPLFSRKADLPVAETPNQNIRGSEFASMPRPSDNSRIQELENENRKLRAQMAELQTLVGILESELGNRDTNRQADKSL